MKRYLLAVLALQFLFSCGPKTGNAVANIQSDIDAYISTVNSNTYLKQEKIEGALTDEEGFKDVGHFEYSVFYDADTKQLYKIKNIENTSGSVSETYYFKDNNLVFVETDLEEAPSKIYVHKNKILGSASKEKPVEKLLLEKGKRFQRAFKETH